MSAEAWSSTEIPCWASVPAHPRGALIFLHGRGGDELELAPFLCELDLDDWALFAPRAPLRVAGEPGAHWYTRRRPGKPDADSWAESLRLFAAWYDATVQTLGAKLPVVLGGFSQGGAIALGATLAGAVPRPDALLLACTSWPPAARPAEITGLPVLAAQAANDEVISPELGAELLARLRQASADLEVLDGEAGHSLDPTWTDAISSWLHRVAASSGAG